MPKLSIITPLYNSAAYLEETVRSVRNQTFTDFELILVNDGSTDGSAELCDRLAAEDSRIRVIHKENGGVASARNAGLDAVRGEYIGWVDSDDLISPIMFEFLLNAAQKYNADIVQCENKRQYDMLTLQMPDPIPEPEITDGLGSLKRMHSRRYANNMALWSKIYRAELWDGIRFTLGQAFEDDERTPKVLYRGKVNLFYDIPLYRYTYRDDSIAIVSKPADVVTLAGHLEERMRWFQTLDEELYEAGKKYFYWFLRVKFCELKYENTPVWDLIPALLKKHQKEFGPLVSRYDRIYILLLQGGNGPKRWVAKHKFTPIQDFLAKIKKLFGR